MQLCKNDLLMNISLIGYMGSGKSTVGKLLASAIHYSFYDLDALIEKEINSSIADYFRDKGEIAFRKLEHELLQHTLTLPNTVLSLGGGTPVYYNNMELINNSSYSVYLQTTIPTLTQRLVKEKSQRPMLQHLTDENLAEFIAKHLFERRMFYEQANFILSTKDWDEKTITNLLLDHLRHQKILQQ